MKNSITYLKTLWRRGLDSQRKQIGVTLGEATIEHPLSTYSAPFGTCWQPSGKLHSVVRCAAMLVMLFTIGIGNAWGDTHTLGWGSASGSSGTYTNFTATSGTVTDIVSFTTAKNSGSNPAYNSSSNELRLYYASNGSGGSITLTPASGVTITGFTITTSTSPTTKYKVGNGSLNTITLSKNTGSITGLSVGSSSSITIQNCNTTNTQLRIKTIQITYTASCTKIGAPTVTATPGNGRIDLSWSNQTGASSYSVTKTPSGGSVGTPSKSGSTWSCAITGLTNGTTYTWSVEAVGSGDYCASGNTAASASATPNVFRTITYYDKDGQHTTSLADGTNIATALTALYGGDDPVSCDATNYEYFVGWKVGEISGTASSVTLLDDEVVNASSPSNNYYAVWSDTDPSAGGWEAATSIAAGDVVVLCNQACTYELNGISTTSTTYGILASVEDETPANLYPLTIEAGASDGTFSFKNGTTYLSWSSGKSLASSTTKNNNSSWTVSISEGVATIRNKSDNTRYLQYNSSGSRFACYTNTQNDVALYKQTSSGTPVYITTCCTDPELAYGTVSVTKTYGEGVFTNTLTNSHSVVVTYSSSDETVATVNGSGQVTILKVGSTTITASSAAQTVAAVSYCADEASYTLTVNKANISPTLTYTPNSVAVGEDSSAPTVGGNPGSGGVTYAITSATPSGCATINTSTGVVSGVAVGSVTVTATVAATTNYNGGTATANVTIHAASYFTNGATVFVQAESSSAWDASACVKAWFNASGAGGAAQTTYWLFDATDGDAGKKLYATIVPASGDLNQVTLQRFASNCSDFWNNNGTLTKASDGGSNTFRSTGSGTSNVAWNGSGMTLDLKGDPNSWGSSLGTFADQGNGVWTATYNNYAPANAAGESQEFKISTNYNGWIGNTGSNNNATLDGMHVGSTYNITATLDVKDHSLTMSKTFVKGTVHFDLQGHGSAISDLMNVAAGSKISAPSAPSATGWDFGGWYKEPACTNAWNFGSDVVNETMTLYAKWTKHNYTITSTLNHCSSSPAIPSSYEYTGSAASLSYTITPSSGYRLPTEITVSGTTYTWNPATGALALTGTISSNVTITIVAVQTHTVDWYVGGSAPANKIGDDGQTTVVDHGGKISDFPATTPDGSACDKVFVGWTNTSSYVHGTSPLFNDVAGSPTINADASFYAVFAAEGGSSEPTNKFSVTLNVASPSVPSGYTLSQATEWKSSTHRQDGSNNPAYIKVYHTSTKLFSSLPSTITIKAGLYGGTARDMSEDGSDYYPYVFFTDNSGNEIAGSAKAICTSVTNSSVEKSVDMDVSKATNAYGIGIRHKKISGFNLRYSSITLTYAESSYTGHTINCADCGSSVTPTYTAASTGGTVSVTKSATPVSSGSTVKTCTAVDLTVTLTPATHYDLTGFTATGLTTGTATITPAVGSTLPVSVAQTFTVTVSAGATGTLTLAPTFTAQTPLSITLETHSKGTFTPIGDVYSGESFTFPTVTPSDAECSSFLGWIEGTTWSGDDTETDPTAITGLANYHAAGSSSGTLTTTKTYTAVFGEKDTQVIPAYQKVTSAPSNWSGDYLIVRDANSRAFDGSLSTLDAADNYIGVTISEGSITANSTVNASKWTIAKVGATSNYTIKSASGYYIGRTANSNGLNSSTSEAYTNTLSYSVDHVVITSSGGPTLQMNSGTRFRYYTSSQQALQLYKYNPDAEVVSYTYTTNPACTPRYRVTISSATGGSPEADKTYEHADETITITANPAAGYSFTSWTITKTTGGDNVTSTLLTGDKPTTANTTFTMPAYDITIAATYAKKMVTELKVMDDETVVANTTGPVSGTLNVSTGANKTLDVVITPSDAFDHSWTASVTAGGTYASITNVTAEGFRVNGLAQGDATITVTASNDEANGGTPKVVTFTVHVTDILPEEIILKREGSDTPIETLIMYYDASESKGQYVKVNVGYSPSNPTNKAFTFESANTGKVGSHSHAPASGYEVLVAKGVTTDPVNCTFTSDADGSVTKVLAVTVLPILEDRFVDYVHGNATQTVSARLSVDRYTMITDINTPSLSDASDADPTSEDCETAHYHLIGWLPQATAEALWAAGTPITEATEGLVKAGVQVEATGQTWYAIWGKEE